MALDFCRIACVVLSYWVISISMLFTNKYLVGSSSDSGGDISLFVAWFQCLVTVIFVLISKLCIMFWNFRSSDWSVSSWKGCFHRTWSGCYRILMLTCSYCSMLSFNNLCLKHVGVAFFQVARSMTLIFTVILTFVILKKSASYRVIGACVVVAIGFVIGVDQEGLVGGLTLEGISYGVVTSAFVALNGIFTKKCLPIVDHDSAQLTLYNNINATFVLLPFVIFSNQFHNIASSDNIHSATFWSFLLATGVLGFAIAWISAVQIDVTSPITHHISANTKSILQTLIAVLYYHTVRPIAWWMSVVMVAVGAAIYAIVRIREDKAESNNQIPVDDVENSALNGDIPSKTTKVESV